MRGCRGITPTFQPYYPSSNHRTVGTSPHRHHGDGEGLRVLGVWGGTPRSRVDGWGGLGISKQICKVVALSIQQITESDTES